MRRVGLDRVDHARARSPSRSRTVAPISSCTQSSSPRRGTERVGVERRAAQRLGGVAVVDALEAHEPPAAGADAPSRTTSVAVAGVEDRARREALGAVGVSVTLTSPRSPWARPIRPTSSAGSRRGHREQRPATRRRRPRALMPSAAPAARATWRSAWTTRPRLPMRRPMSPGSACTRIAPRRARSIVSTSTASGSSAIARHVLDDGLGATADDAVALGRDLVVVLVVVVARRRRRRRRRRRLVGRVVAHRRSSAASPRPPLPRRPSLGRGPRLGCGSAVGASAALALAAWLAPPPGAVGRRRGDLRRGRLRARVLRLVRAPRCPRPTSSLCTCSVGCAPFCSHARAFSPSMSKTDGSWRGRYWPMISM